MAWSWTTAAIGDDWQDIKFLGELYAARNERASVIGQSAATAPVSGDYAALRTWISNLQSFIETYCTSFVQSHDTDGTARVDGHYDGETFTNASGTPLPWFWSLSNLRLSAGINASGFTRLTPSGTSYGIAQVGDYVGSHLFNELKACLDRMLWTVRSHVVFSSDSYKRQGTAITWAGAVADYAAAGLSSDIRIPYALATRSVPDEFGNTTYVVSRVKCPIVVDPVPTAIASAVDWYYIAKANSTYQAHGDGETENLVVLYEQDAAASTSTRSSVDLGNNATGASFVQPSAAGSYGYQLDVHPVFRWSFSYA